MSEEHLFRAVIIDPEVDVSRATFTYTGGSMDYHPPLSVTMSTTGYPCQMCHQWVPWGSVHSCGQLAIHQQPSPPLFEERVRMIVREELERAIVALLEALK